MSRVGNQPIQIPSGVEVKIDGLTVTVKGSKGSLTRTFRDVSIEEQESNLLVKATRQDRQGRAFHGLARALLNNMVTGVHTGFSKTLEIRGTGYRASAQGSKLVLNVGFSHPVEMELPKEVNVKVDKNTIVVLESANNEVLGEIAAKIRRVRPPEPYMGKGIRYMDEFVKIKAGKTAGK